MEQRRPIGCQHRGSRIILLAVLMLCFLGPSVLGAQVDTVLVSGSCSSCGINLERVAVLGGVDLPFELTIASQIAVTSDGRLIVGPTANEAELAVFDRAGRFDHTLGRSGDGPGEYRQIRAVLASRADSVKVLEFAAVTTLRPDLTFADRDLLQAPLADGWTLSPSGELILLAVPVGQGKSRNQLHVVGANGAIVSSFAPAPREYDPRTDYPERLGAVASSFRYGGIWLAKANRHEATLYVDEEPRQLLVRRGAGAFASWEGSTQGEGIVVPPRPAVEALTERSDGLLTLVTRVADASWEFNRRNMLREAGPEGPNPRTLDRQLLFDSVVEVLDPETGRMWGQATSDHYLRSVSGDGSLLYAPVVDVIGRVRLHIFRVQLESGGP